MRAGEHHQRVCVRWSLLAGKPLSRPHHRRTDKTAASRTFELHTFCKFLNGCDCGQVRTDGHDHSSGGARRMLVFRYGADAFPYGQARRQGLFGKAAGLLVDRLQRRSKQQLRFFVARGPAAFAVDALPRDFEQLVDQDHSLGAPAARTGYAMFVEHVMSRQASLHEQLLGSYKSLR